jgi:hypothetical protein
VLTGFADASHTHLWSHITDRPTALSAFTNDLGNYGGFLTSFTETDPTVPYHVKIISISDVANWNLAYGWGNHAGLYLGVGAKAADSELLDGVDSTGFIRDLGDVTITNFDDLADGWVGSNETTAVNQPKANHNITFTLSNDASAGRKAQLFFGDTPDSFYWRPRQGTSSWHPWEKIITSNNIGSQSVSYASNAGTLNGIDSSQFLRSDAADTFTGILSWGGAGGATAIDMNNGDIADLNLLKFADNGEGMLYPDGAHWYYDGNWRAYLGFVQSDESIRGPIFYDSNNTGYYCNPNGQSKFNNGSSQETLILEGEYPQLTIRRTSVPDASIHFDAGYVKKWNIGPGAGGAEEDEFGFAIYDGPRGTHYGTPLRINAETQNVMIGDADHPAFKLDVRGTIRSTADIRGTIFYDENNTGYYVDPMSTSNMNDVQINGTVRFMNYGLGVTGTYTSTRLQTIFNMDDQYSISADGSLTNNAYGLYWSHPNAGGLGGANNLASHGIIILEAGGYKGSWGGGRLVTTADIRGTIFYDYNNTGYYVDPASTSVFSYIQGNTKFMNYGNGYKSYNLYGMVGDYDQNSTAEKIIWTIGDSWNSIGNMYGLGYTYGSGYGHHLSIKNNGTLYHRIGFGGNAYFTGSVEASNDHRAPIFYDSNDTGYYVDPAGTSKMGAIRVGDPSSAGITIEVQPEGTGINSVISTDNSSGIYLHNTSGGYLSKLAFSTFHDGASYGYGYMRAGAQYQANAQILYWSLNGYGDLQYANVAGNLDIGQNVDVWSDFNVYGTKNFRIDHPVSPDTHDLVHSVVESNKADVIYRGKTRLQNGTVSIDIDLELGFMDGTFEALTKDVQVFTTNEEGWTNVKGFVNQSILTILAQDETCNDEVSWLLVGERNDAEYLSSSNVDDNGVFITEPEMLGRWKDRKKVRQDNQI